MRASALSACVVALVLCSCASVGDAAIPSDAEQVVVVVTSNWDSSQGVLQTFQRSEQGEWRSASQPAAVSIGRAGAAWGIGLHPTQAGVQKREGDGRSPAGIFAIGLAFGYDAANTRLPFRVMNEFDYCIDVAGTPLYNQIVDARSSPRQVIAQSTEPMRRDLHANQDQRYKLGFVIEHNPQGLSGEGSCIFAHLWNVPGQTTAGCTAMAEPVMQQLFRWLDARSRPVFVLLPDAEYARLQATWRLPIKPGQPQ